MTVLTEPKQPRPQKRKRPAAGLPRGVEPVRPVDQNLKPTPTMRSLDVWLTVAPPTVAEPRSV